jgi:pSer/pThr/pTyr-binding forkhead associated (FHA) protein
MRSIIGAGTGIIGGLVAGVVGQFIFDLFLPRGGLGALFGMAIFARVAGWAFAGMAVGAAVGVAKGSKSLVIQGMLGGAIGGGIGGLFFDFLSNIAVLMTGAGNLYKAAMGEGYVYGTAGRLFAGTLMGAAIGAAVAMIQEYSKQAWVTVLAGKNEGKDYILTKPSTSMGRDELADIPLFGDKSVEKRHAVIEEHMGTHVLNASGPVHINNLPVRNAQLHHGDLISIGKFTLKFTTRSPEPLSSHSSLPSQPYAQTQSYNPVSYPAGTQLVPRLRAVGGLLNGSVFDISSCQITIGRDTSNAISLSQDTSVSRKHAEIIYENGQYILRDSGSTNGIFVNGQKALEASITPADLIQIGATQFQLVFEPPA